MIDVSNNNSVFVLRPDGDCGMKQCDAVCTAGYCQQHSVFGTAVRIAVAGLKLLRKRSRFCHCDTSQKTLDVFLNEQSTPETSVNESRCLPKSGALTFGDARPVTGEFPQELNGKQARLRVDPYLSQLL